MTFWARRDHSGDIDLFDGLLAPAVHERPLHSFTPDQSHRLFAGGLLDVVGRKPRHGSTAKPVRVRLTLEVLP